MSHENATTRITRLAPSPTGALHLGNARTFIINWAMARQRGWKIVFRIEDLDGPRIKEGADTQAMNDLQWLGLDWDTGPTWQRSDLLPYRDALEILRKKKLIYPCHCTRKDIEQAQSAPHVEDHELRYPGTCRGKNISEQAVNVQQQVGDFVVSTKAGLPAYQLAVVIDDARAGVTDIVRGDDLIGSAARQLLLYEALHLQPQPRYWHLPLVLGTDGKRLAKRHGDTRLAWYRDQGVSVQRIIGLLAKWSGIVSQPQPMDAAEFLARFAIEKLSHSPVFFGAEDHAWLMQK